MPKEYILLKDLPDCDAGAVFVFIDCEDYYHTCNVRYGDKYIRYNKEFVENNPKWFKEVNTDVSFSEMVELAVRKKWDEIAEKNKTDKELVNYYELELERCRKSPYYYATNYLYVLGKKYATLLSEREFNEAFINL